MEFKYLPIVVLFLFAHRTSGQGNSVVYDTVNIYKNKSGVSFNIYMRFWFRQKETFSWNPEKMNSQDSLVMIDTRPHYFKVFGRNNTLLFTGLEILDLK